MIPRLSEEIVLERLSQHQKIILLLGARQVGKTTLLERLKSKLEKQQKTVLYLNCDLEEDRKAINTTALTSIKNLVGNTNYVLIDEAQRLDNPGLTLKIIHDNLKEVRLLVTGSSSFELKGKLTDALTGRYLDLNLYPLSFLEILKTLDLSPNQTLLKSQANALLDNLLLYGFYPDVYLAQKNEDKVLYLEKIAKSYLFKDILAYQKVRNPQAIKELTTAIAYQIGSEINENELANRLKIDRKTVVSYLEILEQAFVIVRLFPYSKNPRREIGKKYKIYFADLGIRNALIGDFNPVNVRKDLGALWENFLIIERIKLFANQGHQPHFHFWRSYGGAEVDYLEWLVDPKKIQAFEFKSGQTKLSKGAKLFAQEYNFPVKLVNQTNYLEFITKN